MTLRALNADFPGPPPEPREAAERLRRLKARRRDALQAALVLLAALGAAIAWEPAFTAATAAGLVAALVIAGIAHAMLSDLLDELAMYPSLSGQPEVAERQRRLIEPDRLAALATQLHRIVDEGPPSAGMTSIDALVIKARVHAVRPRLLAVADALEGGRTADPVAVARLWMLVRAGMASPHAGRALTAEQLDVILRQTLFRLTVAPPHDVNRVSSASAWRRRSSPR
jgi:hypothetical protein